MDAVEVTKPRTPCTGNDDEEEEGDGEPTAQVKTEDGKPEQTPRKKRGSKRKKTVVKIEEAGDDQTERGDSRLN